MRLLIDAACATMLMCFAVVPGYAEERTLVIGNPPDKNAGDIHSNAKNDAGDLAQAAGTVRVAEQKGPNSAEKPPHSDEEEKSPPKRNTRNDEGRPARRHQHVRAGGHHVVCLQPRFCGQ
ncbi:MAG: hypothetical protein ACLPKB_18385 [Xanthobacteraceae bacterium]